MSFQYYIVFVLPALAYRLYNGDIRSHGYIDYALLVAFILLLGWLISPTIPNDPAHHQQTDNVVARRLGQSLNRVWRRLRS